MITLQNITKSFGTLQVLKGIDLRIGDGEVVSIVGPSGAGKTTLLQIIGTLDRPDTGSILFGNTDVSRLTERQLSAFRCSNIGFVFQFHQLLPEFTAVENVMMPALIAGKSMSEAKAMRLEREAARKAEAKEIYNIILSGDYNDVNLQRINDYINESTPRNPNGRQLSQRLPQAVERSLLERDRGNAQDALYSRAAEGASGTYGKISEGTKGAVKAKKIGTAEAAGHCSMKSFTGQQ